MTKFDAKKDDFETPEFTIKHIQEYRAAVKDIKQKRVGGILHGPFELYMVQKGWAKIKDDGTFVITNVNEFNFWIKVRNSVDAYDTWRNEELRAMFPEEQALHRKRIEQFTKDVNAIFLAKTI